MPFCRIIRVATKNHPFALQGEPRPVAGAGLQQRLCRGRVQLQRLPPRQDHHPRLRLHLPQALGQGDAGQLPGCGESLFYEIPRPHLGFRNTVWQEGDVCPPSLFDDKSRFPHHHVAYNMAAQERQGSDCGSALFKSDDTHGRRTCGAVALVHCALPPAR